jgi:hypothetical protein
MRRRMSISAFQARQQPNRPAGRCLGFGIWQVAWNIIQAAVVVIIEAARQIFGNECQRADRLAGSLRLANAEGQSLQYPPWIRFFRLAERIADHIKFAGDLQRLPAGRDAMPPAVRLPQFGVLWINSAARSRPAQMRQWSSKRLGLGTSKSADFTDFCWILRLYVVGAGRLNSRPPAPQLCRVNLSR